MVQIYYINHWNIGTLIPNLDQIIMFFVKYKIISSYALQEKSYFQIKWVTLWKTDKKGKEDLFKPISE